MRLELISLLGVIIIIVASLTLLVSTNWRTCLAALMLQYLGMFTLVSQEWPLPMAAAKLVTGLVVSSVLWISITNLPDGGQTVLQPGRILPGTVQVRLRWLRGAWQPNPLTFTRGVFQLLTGFLVGLVVFSLAPSAVSLIPGITIVQVWGGFFLMGIGLLQLGFSVLPLRTILGLLTVLAGFEVIYAVVETSTLVAGLLAVVNLGLAFSGAYLLIAPTMEETE